MSAATDPDHDAADGGELRYAYRSSLLGAPCEFALKPDALEWQIGRRSGRVRYDRVRSVRLSFRPATMQSHRFITELRSDGNPKLQICSTSWRSMVQQERLDAPYIAFISALHRRLAEAGSTARFSAGMPVLPYWVGVVVFAVVIVAFAVIAFRGLQAGQRSGAAIVGAFALVFAIQLGNYFRRNWPRRYRPQAIPDNVMPSVS
jgi:hypothetical protein